MNNQYRESLITNISEVLPPLADSVSSIVNSIKSEQKIDEKVITIVSQGLRHVGTTIDTVSAGFKSLQKQLGNITTDKEALQLIPIIELHLLLKDALEDISDGIVIIVYLHAKENSMEHAVSEDPFITKMVQTDINALNINLSIDKLFKGSQNLAKVINQVFE